MLFHPVDIGTLHLEGNLFLAPVAGWSDRAFRSICADYGASFACTEMVSSEAIVRGNKKTSALMRRASNEKALAVQLFGSSGEVMGRAAEIVLDTQKADCIDINCGCPVPKITRSGAGSALMRDSKHLGEVVQAVVQAAAGRVPVTVKIRSGWDDAAASGDNPAWQKCAAASLAAGAAAVTLHPRTRAQGYEGKADWAALAALVHFVGGQAAVFGSGDLFSAEDAKRMLLDTGADGVMFARGAMGNPFIFAEARAKLQGGECAPPDGKERIEAGFKELLLLAEDAGEAAAALIMRKRFCAYTKGIAGGAALRAELVHASSIAEYEAVLDKYR